MADSSNLHPFSVLTPEHVIDAVEAQGYLSDGRMLALNSYENRVYQVGLEDATPIIVKFYRPSRWSDEQILEEHAFSFELAEQELPIVTPWRDDNGKTLFHHETMRLTVFERKGGRAPELDNLDNLFTLGKCLGQMHCVGAASKFIHRPNLTVQSYGEDSVAYIAEHMIPTALRHSYQTLCDDILAIIKQRFQSVDSVNWIRCHGDCHIGNILWRDDLPHFVDFDDARMAPAIQDLWMLLSGDRQTQTAQLCEIIEGYEMFQSFNLAELALVESLRTLRIMHFTAWLARRWDDPAFPLHFPWFNTERYWGEHILELREQLALLNEPALELKPVW